MTNTRTLILSVGDKLTIGQGKHSTIKLIAPNGRSENSYLRAQTTRLLMRDDFLETEIAKGKSLSQLFLEKVDPSVTRKSSFNMYLNRQDYFVICDENQEVFRMTLEGINAEKAMVTVSGLAVDRYLQLFAKGNITKSLKAATIGGSGSPHQTTISNGMNAQWEASPFALC